MDATVIRFVPDPDRPSTKNTYRWAEVDDDGILTMPLNNHWVGSIYVQKNFFDGNSQPEEIFVAVGVTREALLEALQEGDE